MSTSKHGPKKASFIEEHEILINKLPNNKPAHSGALKKEILKLAYSASGELAQALPETNYWGLAGYTLIAPEVLKYLTRFALPQPGAIGIAWNYTDAACQGITGIQQLFDTATHRPLVTKTKGIINLASSMQLLVLSSLSTSLGPIGCAAAFGVGFTLSLDETIRHMRRLYSPEYFIVDGLAELDKGLELLQQHERELANLEKEYQQGQQLSKITQFIIDSKKETIHHLKEKCTKIQEQIKTKLDIDRYDHQSSQKPGPLTYLIQHYSQDQLKTSICRNFLESLKTRSIPNSEQYYKALRKKAEIKNEIKSEFIHSISNTVVWGLAFSGVLLSCIPGMQPAGLALMVAASVIYFLKNKKEIKEKAKKLYHAIKKTGKDGGKQIPEIELTKFPRSS